LELKVSQWLHFLTIGHLVYIDSRRALAAMFPDLAGALPTIAPDMDYAKLEGIQEGMAASAAYLEAIDPETSAARKEEIREELLKYCKHDTEAMVRLVGFFAKNLP
jgi:hypothetical protein